MTSYVIYDIKYGTYLASGTQVGKGGHVGPRWSNYKSEAMKFNSINEAKAAMYVLKNIKNQDNRFIIYQKY